MNYEGRRIGGWSFGEEMHLVSLLEGVKIGTFGARIFGKNGGTLRLVLAGGGFGFGVVVARPNVAAGGLRRRVSFGKDLRMITRERGAKSGTFAVRNFGKAGG